MPYYCVKCANKKTDTHKVFPPYSMPGKCWNCGEVANLAYVIKRKPWEIKEIKRNS